MAAVVKVVGQETLVVTVHQKVILAVPVAIIPAIMLEAEAEAEPEALAVVTLAVLEAQVAPVQQMIIEQDQM
jgi:hypothetical protein